MDEKTFWINSVKIPCEGVAPMDCLQVQEGPEIEAGKWQNFYTPIEGFNYEPGYIYRIKVAVEEAAKPLPADASSLRYMLLEEISRTPDRTLRLADIWKVIQIGDISDPMGNGKPLIFEIDMAQKMIFGFSGCNTFRGPIIKVSENELEFGNLAATMMACPAMELENSVDQALKNVRKYSMENNRLFLKDSSDNELMVLLKMD